MKYNKHECNKVCGCGNHADAQRIAIEAVRGIIHSTSKGEHKDQNCAVMLMAVREHIDLLINDLYVGRSALEVINEPSLIVAAKIGGKKPNEVALDFALDTLDDAKAYANRGAIASMYENELAMQRRSKFICEELGNDTYKEFFSSGPTKNVLRNAGFTFDGDPASDMTSDEALAIIIGALAAGSRKKPS